MSLRYFIFNTSNKSSRFLSVFGESFTFRLLLKIHVRKEIDSKPLWKFLTLHVASNRNRRGENSGEKKEAKSEKLLREKLENMQNLWTWSFLICSSRQMLFFFPFFLLSFCFFTCIIKWENENYAKPQAASVYSSWM